MFNPVFHGRKKNISPGLLVASLYDLHLCRGNGQLYQLLED
jgi:hypothetical protein